jgi:uncharacterized protein (DUF2235 family)
MARNLVFCLDGTWNDPNSNTNLYQLYQLLSRSGEQEVEYEVGVGTSFLRLIPGLTGFGLSRQICAGYRWLAERYQLGDRVCLLGASRGAYSARSLAGMIRKCGLIPEPTPAKIKEAYRFYREQTVRPADSAAAVWRARRRAETPGIHFLGVWDTVGRLGIPSLGAWLNWNPERFHDTELSSQVRYAYHALALDEHRRDYAAPVWTNPSAAPGQAVEQRWFLGAHGDVVGGYQEQKELALIPLAWMQQKAQAAGLHFSQAVEVPPDTYAKTLHDSFTDFLRGTYRRMLVRYYRPLGYGLNESLDPSIWQRIQGNQGYLPAQLNGGSPGLMKLGEKVPRRLGLNGQPAPLPLTK